MEGKEGGDFSCPTRYSCHVNYFTSIGGAYEKEKR